MSSSATPGRVLITVSALAITIGSFVADWSATHVFNPRWPPHAKFHNGQTMTASLLLTLLTLAYAHRPVASARERGANLTTAALFNSVYTVAGLAAILYPGAAGMDPEFGEGFPQKWVFGGLLALNWVGWWVGTAALAGGAGGDGVGRKRK